MEKFKGRKGPWHYDDELSGVYSESCRFVCDVTDKNNGVLIAAAPDLLEALQELLEPASVIQMIKSKIKAQAAINKALGE